MQKLKKKIKIFNNMLLINIYLNYIHFFFFNHNNNNNLLYFFYNFFTKNLSYLYIHFYFLLNS